jgi:RNA polymerase sigma-70 factor (ECF subfamily)
MAEIPSDSPVRDRVVLDGLVRGDVAVFTAVYTEYFDRLAVYVRGYVRDSAATEDVVQDVLTSLWHRRTHLVECRSLRAYLYGAARLAALKHLRDTEARERYLSAAASEVEGSTVAHDVDDAEIRRELRRRAVLAATDELPERCREVFLLRWRDGLAYGDIAAVMEISIKTVEMQMTIAVKRLRARLSDPGSDP